MQMPSQVLSNKQSEVQQIKDAKYRIEQVDDKVKRFTFTGAISNNLKFIIAGGPDKLLKIWKFKTNDRIISIKFSYSVTSCKFTDDSQLLYFGAHKLLYQFFVNSYFQIICTIQIHNHQITNIYCISKILILTSSYDNTIIKTDVNLKQQLFKIQAFNYLISGLDYNKILNIIAGGSDNHSIKLWNGNNGSQIIEKLHAHGTNGGVKQVLFIINNQLISLTLSIKLNIIIWNINYLNKKLEQLYQIENSGCNISLVLQQQYIIITCKNFIKVYTIEGHFIRQFDHQVHDFGIFNAIQHNSLKAILIQGGLQGKLFICKINMD